MEFLISMIKFLSIQKPAFWLTLFLILLFSVLIINFLARSRLFKVTIVISVAISCVIVLIGFHCYNNYQVVKNNQSIINFSKVIDERIMALLNITQEF